MADEDEPISLLDFLQFSFVEAMQKTTPVLGIKVGPIVVAVLIVIVGGTMSYPPIFRAASDNLVAALLVVIAVFSVMFAVVVSVGSYQRYVDQFNIAKALRKDNAAFKSQIPLEATDVKEHLRKLCVWLRTPGQSVDDIGRFKDRIVALLCDLFPDIEFGPHLFGQTALMDIMTRMATEFESMIPFVESRSFNTKWKPPQWLLDLESGS